MSASSPLPPSSGNHIWRHLYAGTTLALTILLFTYVGIRIDRHWKSTPWGTLGGAFLGIGAGLYGFIKEFLSDSGR